LSERKIKLIWDFKGPDAQRIAEHHAKHLEEYVALERLELKTVGHLQLSEVHSYAFLVVPENQMIKMRDALKPHRAEIFIA